MSAAARLMACAVSSPLLGALLALVPALFAGPPAHAASGGPDGYGYTWADSASYPYPSYNWRTPTSPTTISYSTLADEGTSAVSLPFSILFYGSTYSTVYVNANGALTFSSGSTFTYSNDCVSGFSGALVAPFGADLDLTSSSMNVTYGTTGSSPNRVFVISWNGVGYYNYGGAVSFQVQIFESDDHIEFHYSDVVFGSSSYDYGVTATVGVRGTSYYLQAYCNTASITAYNAIAFYPPGATCTDADFDGYTDCDGDCDDGNYSVYPGAIETCDFYDNDCDGYTDEDSDYDSDGYTTCNGDCDDYDWTVYPGAGETCDGVDNDCGGYADEDFDYDSDGWTSCGGDCDDYDWTVYPGASESCDGQDNDCDSNVDEGCGDDDDSTPVDDDDSTPADDDDATADDDDDATAGDDDDATAGDDDDATAGDDDGDDDDATADDDDGGGGGGRGGRGGGGCGGGRGEIAGGTGRGGGGAAFGLLAVGLALWMGRRRG